MNASGRSYVIFALALARGLSAAGVAADEARLPAWLQNLGRDSSEAVIAVTARVSPDYVRAREADGSYKPETYVFGKGGFWGGGARDASIDKVNFLSIAHTIAPALAQQRYLPGMDPKTTKFLIMVYWGMTVSPMSDRDSPAMAGVQNAMTNYSMAMQAAKAPAATKTSTGMVKLGAGDARDQLNIALELLDAQDKIRNRIDIKNANILGYDSWWAQTIRFQNTPFIFRKDMIEELEDPRYFVVLMAYDFQLMSAHKKVKLVWETRYSIRGRGNAFDQQLAAMTRYAARYFGQDSGGLLHKPLPEGRVEVGEARPADAPSAK